MTKKKRAQEQRNAIVLGKRSLGVVERKQKEKETEREIERVFAHEVKRHELKPVEVTIPPPFFFHPALFVFSSSLCVSSCSPTFSVLRSRRLLLLVL